MVEFLSSTNVDVVEFVKLPVKFVVCFGGEVAGVDPKISVMGGDSVGSTTFIMTGATISNILISFKKDTYIKIPLTSQFQKQRIR